MGAVNSDNRETAQLSRLIGIVETQRNGALLVAALHAAGALCDFEAACDLRSKALAAAASVAAGRSTVETSLVNVIQIAECVDDVGFDIFGCAVEVSLTLLEAASLQDEPPAEGQSGIVYVSGQHGWVHKDRWVLKTAHMAAVLGAQGVIHSTALILVVKI